MPKRVQSYESQCSYVLERDAPERVGHQYYVLPPSVTNLYRPDRLGSCLLQFQINRQLRELRANRSGWKVNPLMLTVSGVGGLSVCWKHGGMEDAGQLLSRPFATDALASFCFVLRGLDVLTTIHMRVRTEYRVPSTYEYI